MPLNGSPDDLRSFEYERVFGFHANLFLEELAQHDREMAGDIRNILEHALKTKKLYALKNEAGQVDWRKFEAGYQQARKDEAELTAISEAVYQKYQNDPPRLAKLSAAYAKLVTMLVPNKYTARENAINYARIQRDRQAATGKFGDDSELPGFIERILWPFEERRNGGLTREQRVFVFDTIDDAIDHINMVVFEPTLTPHPTYVNTLAATKALQEINDAGCELVMHGQDNAQRNLMRLKSAVAEWFDAGLTPEDEQGLPRSFTPFEEIEQELDALEQIFHNLSDSRRTLDAAFERRATYRKDIPDTYTPEKRLRLNMDIRFKSWVMGDKDGNTTIKAEHLLYSVVARRLRLFKLYQQELQKLPEGMALPNGESGTWVDAFAEAQMALRSIKEELDQKTKGADIPLDKSDLMRLTVAAERVADLFGAPGDFESAAGHFENDLKQAFRSASPEGQNRLIELVDKARCFRMDNGALELRETAEQYTHILDLLVTEDPANGKAVVYSQLPEDEKNALLDRIISDHPHYLAEQARTLLHGIESTEHFRKYDKAKPEVIAYHTLGRLIGAARAGGVKDMILAEFNAGSNILEALALQTAITGFTGRNLDMPVSPLVEELGTLESIGLKVWDALQTRAYRQHLLRQAGGDLSKIRIKVQAAHSDNGRRSGSSAKSAGIYAMHRDLPEFLDEHYADIARLFAEDFKIHDDRPAALRKKSLEMAVEWNEGRSITDTSRGGGRAQTALINLYGLHRHVKETYQNFDTNFLLRLPEGFKRLITRLFTHCAKEIAIQERDKRPNSVQSFRKIEDAVIRAFKNTYADYVPHFQDGVGTLLAHPLFSAELAGVLNNRGSRGVNRDKSASASQEPYDPLTAAKVPTEPMRSIPYGNGIAGADFHLAMLGIRNIEKYLSESFALGGIRELQFEAKKLGYGTDIVNPDTGFFNPAGIQALYRVSPGFRDGIDFVGNGLRNAFLERQQQRLKAGEEAGIVPSEAIGRYTSVELPKEFGPGVRLLGAAFGFDLPDEIGKKLDAGDVLSADECSRLHFLLCNLAFPHSQRETGLHDALATPLRTIQDSIIIKAWKEGRKVMSQFTCDEWRALSNGASGLLLLRHGPVLAQMDPHMGYIDRLRKWFPQGTTPEPAMPK